MSESFQLFLDSKDAIKNNNDYQFFLPNLEVLEGYYLYLSVVSVTIPYSFYNINSYNNYFSYNLDNEINNVVISVGNYNINQLVSELKNQMKHIVITYNSITNKLTFSHNNSDFILYYSKLLGILGFNNINLTSVNRQITSHNCINLNYIRCINIDSNICTYNINRSLQNNSSILCSIPVNTTPYSLIQYYNYNNFRSNLFKNNLDCIFIRLVDNDDNIIDLNGLNFNLTIQLDVESFKI